MSLLKSKSPLYYPVITPLVSFISLCTSLEADLIHSWGTLTLTDIDHVSIMQSIVSSRMKSGGITGQSDPKHSSVDRNLTLPDPYSGNIGSKTRRCMESQYPASRTVSSHESYVNLRPFRKKTSPLIASLSVLGIKFHYIQLIHHGSWLLV